MVFQFIRPYQSHQAEANSTASAGTDTDSADNAVVLISKEDIYRDNRGTEPTLLLKKGYEVSQNDLPRFIRSGAKPHQFSIKTGFRHLANKLGALNTAPILPPKKPENYGLRVNRNRQLPGNKAVDGNYASFDTQTKIHGKHNVLVMNTDDKLLKRTIDCLFKAGIRLNDIHPVRQSKHFVWAVKKYRPQTIVVNYNLPGSSVNGLNLLMMLHDVDPQRESRVLLLPNHQHYSDAEQKMITEVCQENAIELIKGTISRFVFKKLLS
ncbi:MAG: hypothetical protein AAGI66_01755 [Cyanobacteria bacterium P01_H01_bin.74]